MKVFAKRQKARALLQNLEKLERFANKKMSWWQKIDATPRGLKNQRE
jgi:hypothetical protein